MIVGFQARGTPGRALVDGARQVRLWGDEIDVKAQVHTIGGLSAHADQDGLLDWVRQIRGHPRIALVHGEPEAMDALAQRLERDLHAQVMQATFKQVIEL